MILKNKISQWLEKGEIKREIVHPKDICKLLYRALKDIKAAKDNLDSNEEISYMAAYLAVLRAGRAFMFAHGYRPSGNAHHKITFEFSGAVLGKDFSLLVHKIDDMRKRRNQSTYDVEYIDSISEDEAKSSISDAHGFIKAIISFIKNQWPLESEYRKL